MANIFFWITHISVISIHSFFVSVVSVADWYSPKYCWVFFSLQQCNNRSMFRISVLSADIKNKFLYVVHKIHSVCCYYHKSFHEQRASLVKPCSFDVVWCTSRHTLHLYVFSVHRKTLFSQFNVYLPTLRKAFTLFKISLFK